MLSAIVKALPVKKRIVIFRSFSVHDIGGWKTEHVAKNILDYVTDSQKS